MDISKIIEICLLIAGAGVAYGVHKTTVTNLEREDDEQWKVITKMRDWQIEHERDSAKTRLEIEREFGRSREDFNRAMGKMDSMVSIMTELKSDLKNLEEKIDDLKGA